MALVIVGAGPAGLLAAIAASEKCRDIVIFNKNPNPGKKVAAVPFEDFFFSEMLPPPKMADRFGEKADFVAPVFAAFDYQDLIKLFKTFETRFQWSFSRQWTGRRRPEPHPERRSH